MMLTEDQCNRSILEPQPRVSPPPGSLDMPLAEIPIDIGTGVIIAEVATITAAPTVVRIVAIITARKPRLGSIPELWQLCQKDHT